MRGLSKEWDKNCYSGSVERLEQEEKTKEATDWLMKVNIRIV